MHTCRTSARTPCTYAWLLGVSGIAWHFAWTRGWAGFDPSAQLHRPGDMDPVERSFRAVGRSHRRLTSADRDRFRAAVVDTLSGRDGAPPMPVIAFGILGPPEASLIAGYDADGEIAIGWSFFQSPPDAPDDLELEPNGMYRLRGWEERCSGLVLPGSVTERPDEVDTVRDAIELAIEHGDSRHGYDAWIDDLLDDDGFARCDDTALWARFQTHDLAVGQIAEARWYGSLFLAESTASHFAVAKQILCAAACYADVHALMWKVWDAVGGIGQTMDRARRLADPAVRRSIAGLLARAREQEIEAVGHLTNALA